MCKLLFVYESGDGGIFLISVLNEINGLNGEENNQFSCMHINNIYAHCIYFIEYALLRKMVHCSVQISNMMKYPDRLFDTKYTDYTQMQRIGNSSKVL